MKTLRYDAHIDEGAMGAPLGEAPEPLSRDAIAELQRWMVSTYGSTREIDYIAAMHGGYHQSVEDALIEAEEQAHTQETVRAAVLELPMLEAGVICKRYGLWDAHTMTLRELGAALGLSHTMIAKYERRAIDALRVSLSDWFTSRESVQDIYRDNEFSERAA